MFKWLKKAAQAHTKAGESGNVSRAVREDIRRTIESLDKVSAIDADRACAAAIEMISKGSTLPILYEALASCDGISASRAKELTIWIHHRTIALVEAEKRTRLGIEYAEWIYSGAPCGNAEQDALHRAAHGKRYRVAEGLRLNGRTTLPGRELGCKCTSRPIIEGFDED